MGGVGLAFHDVKQVVRVMLYLVSFQSTGHFLTDVRGSYSFQTLLFETIGLCWFKTSSNGAP